MQCNMIGLLKKSSQLLLANQDEWKFKTYFRLFIESVARGGGGGGVLPCMGYTGMCRCEGYGFQAVYSRIGYINQSVWV